MNAITITAGSVTYVVSLLKVPSPEELPWGSEECDAFVMILEPKLLTDQLAEEICGSLVRLPTGWVDANGPRSEHVHDLVDRASVKLGRQAKVGDGNPMTTWDNDMRDVQAMIEWLRLGGPGAADNKLVVLIAEEHEAAANSWIDLDVTPHNHSNP